MKLYHGGICFITDRGSCQLTCTEMIEMALDAGVNWVQLRDKERDRLGLYRIALKARALTRAYGATLIINDHADIAAAVDADGVHLGQDDLPIEAARQLVGQGRIVGISTHSVKEAISAERAGADYIGFGPVFKTSTKEAAGRPKGTEMISRIRASVKIPVVAIGGISCKSLKPVIKAGADAVAVASGVLRGAVQSNFMQYLSEVQKSAR